MENQTEKAKKTVTSWNDALINLSICLTDIPKDKIKKASNGKLYIGITVKPRKTPDDFGQDTYAVIAQSKEERAAKVDQVYIANGDYVSFKSAPESVAAMGTASAEDMDDLPF